MQTMALPLEGAGSTAGVLESCAAETGPVMRNVIALNASRRLASDLQPPLRQSAATQLKAVLRMGAFLPLVRESGGDSIAGCGWQCRDGCHSCDGTSRSEEHTSELQALRHL